MDSKKYWKGSWDDFCKEISGKSAWNTINQVFSIPAQKREEIVESKALDKEKENERVS